MFFMGVLGWPPSVVMCDAGLEDLADAYEGYSLFHRGSLLPQPSLPSQEFLREMVRKFPDMRKN